jgi:hypothetical protein
LNATLISAEFRLLGRYYGEDEGNDQEIATNSPGAIVIETLLNIRTVASLTLEEERAYLYGLALKIEESHSIRCNVIKGSLSRFWQC